MALYNYFSKLGITAYNNDVVANIITSIRFNEVTKTLGAAFYPYVITEGERPDIIAANYYGDERYAWVVLLSNSISDPYYDWPLTTNQFQEFIAKKYTSIADAQNKIAFYRSNWYTDDSLINTVVYNALSTNLKKYWAPIVGYNNAITSYERKKLDLFSETNSVVEVTLNNTTDLAIGDKVIQRTSGNLSASGVIRNITDSVITVVHNIGTFANTGGSVGSLTKVDGSTSKTVTKAATIYNGIPLDEMSYWEPVTFYDYENELNESKKTIQLLDKQYLDVVEDQMIEILS